MDLGNSKVLVRKTSNLNMQTGEIVEKEESVLLRTKKRERFMLLYVENFNAVVNLRKKSQEVLAQILAKRVTYGTNEVILDSVFRSFLAKTLETSKQVIVNSIAELVEKKVLKREKREGGYVFFLNSYLFGQGDWNTIEKQRQQFTIDYDFVNLTAEKEVKTITAYEGLPNKENIQVIKREQYMDEQGVSRDDVLIEEKQNAQDKEVVVEVLEEATTTADVLPEASVKSDYGFEMLKEENRKKELDLREKELAVRELELRVQMMKFEKQQEKSLFDS